MYGTKRRKNYGARMRKSFLLSMGIHIIYLRQRIVESEFIFSTNKTRTDKIRKDIFGKKGKDMSMSSSSTSYTTRQ